jgi:hypothetical protein
MTGHSVLRPRVRPFIRRTAIGFCLLLLPLLAHGLWDHIELRRLIGEIERIRQRSEPVTVLESELPRAALSEASRRAGLYFAAAGTLATAWRQPPAAIELREWLAGGRAVREPRALGDALRGQLDDSREALDLADKARALGFAGFEAGTDYSYRAAGLIALGQLTAARTLRLALDDQGDAAVDSAMTALEVRRALGDRPLLPAGAHETAAILSLSRPSEAALVRLQTALAAGDAAAAPAAQLIAERARHIEQMWRGYYGPSPATPWRYTLPMRSVGESLLRPWLTHHLANSLRAWADLIAAAEPPAPQRFDAVTAIVAKYGIDQPTGPPTPPSALFFRRVVFLGPTPAYVRDVLRADRQIVDRCSRVALAIERYRRVHGGATPATLGELAPAFLDRLPVDPLSGKVLLYRSAPDAYIVYSVGADGVDNGGDLTSELQRVIERGWGRRAIRGRDIGVRVLTH